MVSGITRMRRYPLAAARAARAIPVLPEVGSMITVPGVSSPFASPSSSMALATRSFTEPAGWKASTLASIRAASPCFCSRRVSSSRGVLPINWSADVNGVPI